MRKRPSRNLLTGLSGLQLRLMDAHHRSAWGRNPLTGLSGLQLSHEKAVGGPERVAIPLRG